MRAVAAVALLLVGMPVPERPRSIWARLIVKRMRSWQWPARRIAELLEVPDARVSDWIHSRCEPSDEMKLRIVERLQARRSEVTPEWVLRAQPDPDLADPEPPALRAAR